MAERTGQQTSDNILGQRPEYSSGTHGEDLVGHIINITYEGAPYMVLVTSFTHMARSGNPINSLYYFANEEIDDINLQKPGVEYTVLHGSNIFPEGEDYKG